MKICYDQTKYVKGKRIYRLQDIQLNRLYLLENDDHIVLIKPINMDYFDNDKGYKSWGLDYEIQDTFKYRLNSFTYHLHDFFMQQKKDYKPSYAVYEAVEPHFTCKGCGSHELPHQVQAVRIYNKSKHNEYRIGRFTNYCRCSQCRLLQRHMVDSGYPTRWELQSAYKPHRWKRLQKQD